MVNSCGESNLCGLEGIVGGEVDVQEENTTNIRRIIRTHNCCLPMVGIFLVDGTCGAVCWWVLAKVDKLLLNSFQSSHFMNYK